MKDLNFRTLIEMQKRRQTCQVSFADQPQNVTQSLYRHRDTLKSLPSERVVMSTPLVVSQFETSSTAVKKRVNSLGARTQPCLTPCATGNASVNSSLINPCACMPS